MIIPGQFGFNCPSGFREEAFWNIFPIGSNVKLGWETGERRASSESFSPFRAESNKFYIYRQQTNIVFILQSTMS